MQYHLAHFLGSSWSWHLCFYLQVITGKGNDTYQIEGDKSEFFDDREECREALQYVDQLHRAGIDTSEFPWRYASSKSVVKFELIARLLSLFNNFFPSIKKTHTLLRKIPKHSWHLPRNSWFHMQILWELQLYWFCSLKFSSQMKSPIYCLVLFTVSGYQKATDFDLVKIVEFINWRSSIRIPI